MQGDLSLFFPPPSYIFRLRDEEINRGDRGLDPLDLRYALVPLLLFYLATLGSRDSSNAATRTSSRRTSPKLMSSPCAVSAARSSADRQTPTKDCSCRCLPALLLRPFSLGDGFKREPARFLLDSAGVLSIHCWAMGGENSLSSRL